MDARQVMPAVPDRVVLDDELRGYGRSKAKRKGGRSIKFLIGECADLGRSLAAVSP
jgi:hypothetical protein